MVATIIIKEVSESAILGLSLESVESRWLTVSGPISAPLTSIRWVAFKS